LLRSARPIHNHGRPIPGEFDDYIGAPKSNNTVRCIPLSADRAACAGERSDPHLEMHQHSELENGWSRTLRYEGSGNRREIDEKNRLAAADTGMKDEDL